MKLLKLASAALVLAASFAVSVANAQSTWKSDPAHSEVDFTIKHLGISNVHGRLGHVDATIVHDEKDVTKSTINATIDVTGIDTGESARDNHLKSPDFFDTAQFPTAKFVSTSVAKGGAGLQVSGNLTIKNVTKPVVLDVEGPGAPVPDMQNKSKVHMGYSGSTTIHRSDFNLGSKFPAAMLGDDVKITFDLDVVK
jgi:polyisoprenoid-binding protein YceI